MPGFERSMDVAASVEVAWAVLADVERWPEWTASMALVELRTPAPCSVGSKVWIHQPKLKPGLWTVTHWDVGEGFTWEQRQFGLRIVGDHRLSPIASGCRLNLTLDFAGFLSRPVTWFGHAIINRYLDLEAEGFRKRATLAASG